MKGLLAPSSPAKGEVTGLTPKRQQFLKDMVDHPELYVWGTDPEGSTGAIVRTLDKADRVNPVKPLPTDWAYQPFLLAEFHAGLKEAQPQLPGMRAVDKPRQMMVSWFALLYSDFICLTVPYARVLINKATQDESSFLIKDRLVNVVHKHWPQWFRDWAGAEWKETDDTLYYANGSSMAATGENVDDRAARGEQATVFFVDEAARHPRLREVVAAIYPMTSLILLVSTPEAGSPGSAYYAEILQRDSKDE